ncbi:hypothetical protein [Rhodocyclus tenuis]|uniref:Bacteriophage protein n=1 Tax=Rhodocyclus tenuis TaxID=1066 RepID=A0A840FZD9_RHOTE|nr:hypothetical protein [Rhodocyclus tenuis]MBB4247254.1 hypothetical protein [Rhodocyclus tenuis]
MSALTADRNTPSRDNVDFEFPVAASTKIYAGGLTCLNAAGTATKGAVSTTLKTVGVAQATVDNSAGAAGDKRVKVRRGCFKFGNSASTDLITLANVGASAYIVDDQTVALTSGSSTRSIAGTIRDVESDGVWIEI